MPHSPREARLKPEFAAEYPELVPGVWHPAASIAAFLLTRQRALGQADSLARPSRPVPTEHFEFRGGSGSSGSGRERVSD